MGAGRFDRRPSLVDDLHDFIRGMVMDRTIEPGEPVNISDLAERLGVSHTPVREALARLEAERLVTRSTAKGYRTAPIYDQARIVELFDLRRRIEPWAAAAAAHRIDDAGARRLEGELAAVTAVPQGSGYAEYRSVRDHDERFHLLLLELSGNRSAYDALESLHVHVHTFRLGYRGSDGVGTVQEHRDVGEAVLAGDADAAEQAMHRHLDGSMRRLSGPA